MGKVAKLICITTINNNKFYNMTENDNGTFTALYGRVGANAQTTTKPMSQWDKVYSEKTSSKKGYKDVTDLFIVEGAEEVDAVTKVKKTIKDFLSSRSLAVVNIVKKLQGWAKGSIEENYTVSAENVTQKQVDKAQSLLNDIALYDLTTTNINAFNNLLLEFFSIVPRKMKQVKDHLINIDSDILEQRNKIVSSEQDTLDVMAGQVQLQQNITDTETTEEVVTVETDIISASGLELEEVTDSSVIATIKKLMGDQSHKFKQAYAVVNNKTQKGYDKQLNGATNKKEELFWHGSRNENWWSILTTGLLIRPSNAVHSGSMWSDGIYFASKCLKSMGYTSMRNSYYARGNSNEAILALYSVHVGNQDVRTKHDSSCYSITYNSIKAKGFDSVHAKAGASIMNDEFIVYQSQQCTVKYLVIVEG